MQAGAQFEGCAPRRAFLCIEIVQGSGHGASVSMKIMARK
jgi:hypothetical protein